MSLPNPRTGQCIFCAFRQQSRNLRRLPPVRTASLSTSSSLIREPKVQSRRRRQDGDDFKPFKPWGRDGEGSKSYPSRRRDGGKFVPLGWKNGYQRHDRKAFARNTADDRLATGRSMKRFKDILLNRLECLEPDLRDSPVMAGLSEEEVSASLSNFSEYMHHLAYSSTHNTKMEALKKAFIDRGIHALDAQLKYNFYGNVLGKTFTKTDIENQRALADLRFPIEWFPSTRANHRAIHVHVGPTNSGKTYHALKRLEQAKSGVYAGPLRLLAHEVYTRMNSAGRICALVTGEEVRRPADWDQAESKIVSCTVEMTPMGGGLLDVAVIDEIQMLGNDDRGWAWTQAFLGVKAKEVHVCGEERALPLIQKLAAGLGEKVTVHRYERLTSLQCEPESLRGDFSKLRKGDCVVTFSVMAIHALRAQIEKLTGKRVAIIYGSLPPETRAAQARLFNDPNNDYDILVASDAIGMGLNLSIKRVIFETVQKNNGFKIITLSTSEIRQIAGRAGRYKVAPQTTDTIAPPSPVELGDVSSDSSTVSTGTVQMETLFPAPPDELSRPPFDKDTIGLVTTLEPEDYQVVVRAMETEAPPLTTAGILPSDTIVQRFCNYFPPSTPFSYILMRLHELSQSSSRFHLCQLKDQVAIADVIHDIPLDTTERLTLCSAPASVRDKKLAQVLKELATCVAEQQNGGLLDLKCLNLDILDKEVEGTRPFLKELETLHKSVVMYLWLSFRFPGVFTTRPLANHVKELVENHIEKCLRMLSFKDRTELRKALRKKSVLAELSKDLMEQEMSEEEGESHEIRNGRLESELKAAADRLDEEGNMEFDKKAAREMRTDTATSETPLDDEGEYPEEGLEGDESLESTQPKESFTGWRAVEITQSLPQSATEDISSVTEEKIETPTPMSPALPRPPHPTKMQRSHL